MPVPKILRSLVALLVVSAVVAAPASALPTLREGQADELMQEALERHPKLQFVASNSRIDCGHRNSPSSRNCKMGWAQGDASYWGNGKIWLTEDRRAEATLWNYAYRVVRENTYCSQVEHRHDCRTVFVVR